MSHPVLPVKRVFSGPKGEKTQHYCPWIIRSMRTTLLPFRAFRCGKSTLLRIVAGLDQPTRGEVWLDGVLVDVRARIRGMVFQSYTLSPVDG